MTPGDVNDRRSSKRRHKDRSRREKRHKRSRSRSPTRKHRRSESKRIKKRSKSRRRSYSSSSSSSSSSSLSSSEVEKKKRRKSKHHSKKRKHRHRDTRCTFDESDSNCNDTAKQTPSKKSALNNDAKTESDDKKQASTEPKQPKEPEQPVVQSQAKGPMTQAQYLQLQSQIREVVDPATGRVRLVRGTGEIIERIVSRNEHQNLNALATRGDGDGFARDVARQAMQRRMGR